MLVKLTATRQPVDGVAHCSAPSSNTVEALTDPVVTMLQPHTSSPSLHTIARAITHLIMGNFGDAELCQILNAQLDTLAISPQAKQGIVPALVGFAKLAGAQSQG